MHDTIARGSYFGVRADALAGRLAGEGTRAGGWTAVRALSEIARGRGHRGGRRPARRRCSSAGSPLALPMTAAARRDRRPALGRPSRGLHPWSRRDRVRLGPRPYGDRLPGWTPVYLRYNTGRRITDNGAPWPRCSTAPTPRDRPDRALDGRPRGPQRLPSRRRLDVARARDGLARHPALRRPARQGRARRRRRWKCSRRPARSPAC
jgi:hypothetical protein